MGNLFLSIICFLMSFVVAYGYGYWGVENFKAFLNRPNNQYSLRMDWHLKDLPNGNVVVAQTDDEIIITSPNGKSIKFVRERDLKFQAGDEKEK